MMSPGGVTRMGGRPGGRLGSEEGIGAAVVSAGDCDRWPGCLSGRGCQKEAGNAGEQECSSLVHGKSLSVLGVWFAYGRDEAVSFSFQGEFVGGRRDYADGGLRVNPCRGNEARALQLRLVCDESGEQWEVQKAALLSERPVISELELADAEAEFWAEYYSNGQDDVDADDDTIDGE